MKNEFLECDRCGKFYEFYEGDKIFKDFEKANAIWFVDFDLKRDYYVRKTYDLCPECMKKLVKIFK